MYVPAAILITFVTSSETSQISKYFKASLIELKLMLFASTTTFSSFETLTVILLFEILSSITLLTTLIVYAAVFSPILEVTVTSLLPTFVKSGVDTVYCSLLKMKLCAYVSSPTTNLP